MELNKYKLKLEKQIKAIKISKRRRILIAIDNNFNLKTSQEGKVIEDYRTGIVELFEKLFTQVTHDLYQLDESKECYPKAMAFCKLCGLPEKTSQVNLLKHLFTVSLIK